MDDVSLKILDKLRLDYMSPARFIRMLNPKLVLLDYFLNSPEGEISGFGKVGSDPLANEITESADLCMVEFEELTDFILFVFQVDVIFDFDPLKFCCCA